MLSTPNINLIVTLKLGRENNFNLTLYILDVNHYPSWTFCVRGHTEFEPVAGMSLSRVTGED